MSASQFPTGFPSGWQTVSEHGNIEGYCVGPAESANAAPGGRVVLLQEIFGVSEAMHHKATKLSELGYRGVCADVFAHLERRVDLGYTDSDRQRGFALLSTYDPETALEHCHAVAEWARHLPGSNGKLAVVGFCIGGLLARRYAARHDCDAAVPFYGVLVHEHLKELRSIESPVQYHVGTADTHILSDQVKAIQDVVEGMPNANAYTYAGAKHGFFNSRREEVFNQDAFALANKRMLELLSEKLQ